MPPSNEAARSLESEPNALRVLHESVVREDEIDALGHMNVRFYGARALASTARLLRELADELDDSVGAKLLSSRDYDLPRLFTRYQREQHAGSSLVVLGGLIDVTTERIRLYHELRNPERDELAASFVHDVVFRAAGGGAQTSIPDALREALAGSRVGFPDAGSPRSIDLDRPPVAPTLDEAIEGGLAFRRPRVVEAESCDAQGRVTAENRPFYMWGGEPIASDVPDDGPPLFDLADGGKMGWASMETRSVLLEPIRVGTRVQSFAATVELARKTNLRRYWIYDLDSKQLLLSNEVVELALHLGKRRAIEIPPEIRDGMAAGLREDLR